MGIGDEAALTPSVLLLLLLLLLLGCSKLEGEKRVAGELKGSSPPPLTFQVIARFFLFFFLTLQPPEEPQCLLSPPYLLLQLHSRNMFVTIKNPCRKMCKWGKNTGRPLFSRLFGFFNYCTLVDAPACTSWPSASSPSYTTYPGSGRSPGEGTAISQKKDLI